LYNQQFTDTTIVQSTCIDSGEKSCRAIQQSKMESTEEVTGGQLVKVLQCGPLEF